MSTPSVRERALLSTSRRDYLKGTVPDLEQRRYDTNTFQEHSRVIEELRTQDFGALQRELDALYPTDTPPPVPQNIIDRTCKEIAELYVLAPTRILKNVRPGQQEAIERIWRNIDWDRFMQLGAEQSVAHNSVILSVEPGVRVGRPTVSTWLPHQVWVTFEDPSRASCNIQEADRVEIRVPVNVQQSDHHLHVIQGRRVYTRDEAWLEDPATTKKIPLIGDTIRHGLGYIPLAGERRTSHRDGDWLPPLPYDLLCIAINVGMAVSDWFHIARYQSFTRDYMWGQGADKMPKSMPLSPRAPIIIPVQNVEDFGRETVQPNPPLEKYVSTVDKALEYFESNRSLSRASLKESSGITGDAKAEERQDQERERRRMENMSRRFEEDALQVMVDVLRIAGEPAFLSPMQPDVFVEYHYIEPRQNKLQSAQADQLHIDQGRTSAPELEARDSGIPIAAAAEKVAVRKSAGTEDELSLRQRAEAAGVLIRAGFEATAAAAAVGLPELPHVGQLPVTLKDDTGGQTTGATGATVKE